MRAEEFVEYAFVEYEEHGPITVGRVLATSVLDAANVSQFGTQVLRYVQERSGMNLLLDFTGVGYLSSAVLTELIRIQHAHSNTKGSLRLCALNKDIRKVFAITNLDQVFVIDDIGVGESIKRFQRSLKVAKEDNTWLGLRKGV